MLEGLMMDYPLTLNHFRERAARYWGKQPIITRTAGGTHRYTFAATGLDAGALRERARRYQTFFDVPSEPGG